MQPRFEFARKMARKYLRKHRVVEPPVPVEFILVAEEVRVEALVYPDATAGESWWEAGVGHVAANRTMPRGRLRFTLAHEFGHLVLLHHPMRFETADLGRMRDLEGVAALDPLEVEANAFAAELLLPGAMFKRDWERRPNERWIAARYEVSVEAVRQRLRSM